MFAHQFVLTSMMVQVLCKEQNSHLKAAIETVVKGQPHRDCKGYALPCRYETSEIVHSRLLRKALMDLLVLIRLSGRLEESIKVCERA